MLLTEIETLRLKGLNPGGGGAGGGLGRRKEDDENNS